MAPDPDRPFDALPASAAWRHVGGRQGFETARFERLAAGGTRVVGHTAALDEDHRAWTVSYDIELGLDGVTRRGVIVSHGADGDHRAEVVHDGAGHWLVDGQARPELDGCLDLDLESSSLTNAFPVRRLALPVGALANAPAAWVRAHDASVERLEQSYLRLADDPTSPRFGYTPRRFAYTAPQEQFAVEITYDDAGLALDYPQIAARADLFHEYPEPPPADELLCCAQDSGLIGVLYDAHRTAPDILTSAWWKRAIADDPNALVELRREAEVQLADDE